MLLIGSRALLFRAPHLLKREPKDFDFISTEDEALSFLKNYQLEETSRTETKIISQTDVPCEFEIVKAGNSAEKLIELVENDPKTIKTDFGLVPSLDLLFTLKASHKYLKNSPFFWKTAYDYHTMKTAGAQILPEYQEFFKQREKETYNYYHPKLNVTKDNFFKDDSVKYIFDHDDIHKSIAQGVTPAYTYYLKDGAQVDCDKEKFFSLPEEIRINGGIEEAAVLAIERSLVPYPDSMTPKRAWLFALSKVCSSITSGWFREHCYENIFKIVKRYPEGYWEKFQKDVAAGLVRPFLKDMGR